MIKDCCFDIFEVKSLISNWKEQARTPCSICTEERQLLRKVTIKIHSLNIIKVKYLAWPHHDFILEIFIQVLKGPFIPGGR